MGHVTCNSRACTLPMLRCLPFLIALTAASCLAMETPCASCDDKPPSMVMPRTVAPTFTAKAVNPDGEFVDVDLASFRGKYVVLVFYPFDFTFVCPTELVAFSEKIPEFDKLNTAVLGISTDSHHTHRAWTNTDRTNGGVGKLNYPLVADISKLISRDYGVLVTNKEDPMFGAALRGLFIIDPKGTVRTAQINDDQVGRSVDETIRLIKAFQFADEHGTVCPANWKPGDATMKPDPKESKTFFNEWGKTHGQGK